MKKASSKNVSVKSFDSHKDVAHSTSKGHHDNSAVTALLSDTDVSSLLFMIEEEKMARDIYDALFDQTGLIQFDRISNSEQHHYDTLLSTANKLGIDTDALSTEAGVFTNIDVQNLYDQLISQGSVSTDAAVKVGIAIEQTDIADLYAAIDSTEITLLGTVYNHLLDASINHLNAFENIA
jgi:hypothetical protein